MRTALAGGAAVGLGAGLPAFASSPTPATDEKPADRKLKILILGGTGFLGPHTVRRAVARGHEMTLFNRGKTNPSYFPELEKLQGDRNGDLKILENRKWDAVIDTSGYYPRQVRTMAGLLAPNIGQYMFISSISVYADRSKPGVDESSPVDRIEDDTTEKVDGRTYGPLKALCEEAAEAAMPGKTTNIRPGLIVGPEDPTDRFTYWPARVSRGGEVLSPGSGDDYVQSIDVRDLAAFMIHCLEQRITGVFNADSPADGMTMRRLLETCKKVSKSDATFTWVPAEFLEAHEVQPWSHMPVWVPPHGEYGGVGRLSTAKATASGLRCRPLEETVEATLAWLSTLPEERRTKMKAGVTPEKEKQVLEAWHARAKAAPAAAP
jgi:2'-hydroxyisoflavone reductase